MATDRTRLVEALRADRSLSFAELARATRLDESTIATLLHQLEQDGLPMQKEGDTHFKLVDNITPIDVGDLISQLEKANFPFARQAEVLDTVDSTSDWLNREHHGGMDIHGKTCITEFQSAGRGRRGRNWRGSPYCHLMLSIGWRFQKEVTEMAGLSLSIGVAIAECLKDITGAPVGLKWPNDLWCKERKLGGILVDLNALLEGGAFAVIGIGINLREPRLDEFDTGQPVTDLASNAQDDLASRATIIASVLGSIAQALDRFEQHHFLPDQARFNALDVFSGRKVRAESDGRPLEGVGAGADEQGRYRLRCADGTVATVISGDISLSLVN
ncbi:MAG TPA: biotin--[acetyl-CoA-carboxylase] ligase [Gammaproteobacteria bacterium]|jgi:BirA family biotin operon repressor/biotin-[acetyl-CoA-carboxylase] ligase|nr:biotin--[acetyl-CoA-carboxylase] ligase [Acidiferrobacteraceae bacterium]MDP6398628.1 biotin--[acetyl-CoA-carboxylase] ligase [Arenicellales bacterium]MDP6552823.1 biotin--[acetyl-CoA-carboxylase] ligase [Arenicellales bacterium]MDP6918923.1 biotin--[acetyl-CoA-carboxylase] ligase [Arenicellales bacterium]HCX87160.1 biotin--[acetyl-CoA-carboxylase] ligase [Gammaproteobacteria bacterium]|tara:strand:- start:1516 stop:2505 length:990 start_codon:yes stop_codon:yes gene_type:complete